jgi:hypothetical protein
MRLDNLEITEETKARTTQLEMTNQFSFLIARDVFVCSIKLFSLDLDEVLASVSRLTLFLSYWYAVENRPMKTIGN